jgi:hypothetical protein
MSHVPLYVYVLFLILLRVGISRCYPRTIRIERLLVMPILMLALGIHGFSSLFSRPNAADLLAGACGIAAGLVIGHSHVRNWSIGIDRARRRISVPGDVMMLVVILAAFAFEFALHYAVESRAVAATDPLLPPLAAAVWGLFIGMTAGRNFSLASRFRRAWQDAAA